MKLRSLKSIEIIMLFLFVIIAVPNAIGGINYTNRDNFIAAMPSVVNIDFEGIATTSGETGIIELIGDEFSDCYGVTLSGTPTVGIPETPFWEDFDPTSPVACLAPDSTGSPSGIIEVTFDTPVVGVGAYFLDVQSSPTTPSKILALGPTGQFIGQVPVPSSPTPDGSQSFVGIINNDPLIPGIKTAYFYIGVGGDTDGAAIDDLIFEETVTIPPVQEIEIDIKPGSYPNTINLGSNGVVPVAILSSEDFDATTVDPATVSLSGAGVALRGKGTNYLTIEKDVNGDGLTDLEVKIETENLDPDTFQDGYAILTINTGGCWNIEGIDEITIVPQ